MSAHSVAKRCEQRTDIEPQNIAGHAMPSARLTARLTPCCTKYAKSEALPGSQYVLHRPLGPILGSSGDDTKSWCRSPLGRQRRCTPKRLSSKGPIEPSLPRATLESFPSLSLPTRDVVAKPCASSWNKMCCYTGLDAKFSSSSWNKTPLYYPNKP